MTKIQHFTDLKIWHEANYLCSHIYKITKEFPREEKFGIISQLQRSSSSIGANIAEGFGRYHYKDKVRFFYQARGSLHETQNFLLLSVQLEYIDKQKAKSLVDHYNILSRSIHSFIKSIQQTYDNN